MAHCPVVALLLKVRLAAAGSGRVCPLLQVKPRVATNCVLPMVTKPTVKLDT